MRLSTGFLAFAVLVSAGCFSHDSTAPSSTTLGIAPNSVYLTPGDSITLSATRSGSPEVGVNWTSDDTSVVVITQQGGSTALLRAKSLGLTTVGISKGGEHMTIPVAVQAPAVSRIAINPSGPATYVGGRVVLTAEVRNADGDLLTNRHIGWASNNTQVALIDDDGTVHGISVGTAIISAYSEGQVATTIVYVQQAIVATVVVVPSPATVAKYDSLQLRGIPLDVHYDTLQGTPQWTSSDTTVVKIAPNGMAYGLKEGTATVTAVIEDKVGVGTITVGPAKIATVTLNYGDGLQIPKYSQIQFFATARDVMGNVITGHPVTWSSSDPTTISIDQNGLSTGLTAGAATITAQVDDVRISLLVPVLKPRTASILLSPSSASLTEGDTVRIVPTALDSHGNPIVDLVCGFLSLDGGTLVTVDASGLARVIHYQNGSTQVRVTCDNISTQFTITLVPPSVSYLTISPGQITVSVGSRFVVTAVAYDATGHPLPAAPIAFQSSDVTRATVDASGVVQTNPNGLGATGAVSITASSGGKSISSQITIIP